MSSSPASATDPSKSTGVEQSPVDSAEVPTPAYRHPALQPLIQLQDNNDPVRARLGFKQLADSIESRGEPATPEGEALWLEAVRQSFQTAIETEQFDLAIEELTLRFEHFRQPFWASLRASTDHFFQDMMRLSIKTKLDEEAFDLYESTRDHIRIPADLRVQLLRVASRLGRFDPATARLCLEELASEGDRTQEDDRNLFETLRLALRVVFDSPSDELLAELRDLNRQVLQVAPQLWATAHLAIAEWRLGNIVAARQLSRAAKLDKSAPHDTHLLLGAVNYLLGQWVAAEAHWDLAAENTNLELESHSQFFQLLGQLNTLLERRGQDLAWDDWQQEVTRLLTSVRELDPSDAWQLDLMWVAGSACAAIGQDEEALRCFEMAPSRLGRWRHAWTAWWLFSTRRDASVRDQWIQSLRVAQPGLATLLEAGSLINDLRFEDARRQLALVGESQRNLWADESNREHASAMRLLEAELAAGGATATPEPPMGLPTAFAEWGDQLRIRRHVEFGNADAALRLATESSQFTAESRRHRRLVAVVDAVSRPQADHEIDAALEALAAESGPGSLDALHWGLRLVQLGRTDDAELILISFFQQFPDCIEATLGRVECLLAREAITEARELLLPISQMSRWANQPRLAWFRPWSHLVPQPDQLAAAQVAVPRIADLLHAIDLQVRAGLLSLAIETLGHLEHLAGESRGGLAIPVAERFGRCAVIEARDGNWDAACRHHQAASARGVQDSNFTESVALGFATATTAPDEVLKVLLDWVTQFKDDEAAAQETIPGQVFLRLTAVISATDPEGEQEFEHRVRWSERSHKEFPAWNAPIRSLMRAHARRFKDEEVVKKSRELNQWVVDDHRILARALWNLGRFSEAAAAFAAAEERAWSGCARAAALFQEIADSGQWLDQRDADFVLADLQAQSNAAELPPQLTLWTGAVLVASGRGQEALPHLLPLEVPSQDTAGLRVLIGLAHLQAGDLEAVSTHWGPAVAVQELLLQPQRLVDWNRREACLWLLAQLQRPGSRHLPELGALIAQLQRLWEADEAFEIVRLQFALRLGDSALAAEIWESLKDPGPIPAQDILAAPLRCVMRAEREFLRCRMSMQTGRFGDVEPALATAAQEGLWPTRAMYWRAMCQLRIGRKAEADALLTELATRAPGDATILTQLALLKLDLNDGTTAEQLTQAALKIDPEHGFALLVSAQLEERRGKDDAAATIRSRLLALPGQQVSRRVQASAELALGRHAIQAKDFVQAEIRFRTARRLMPTNPVPIRRLGVLLAAQAVSPETLLEADQLLTQITSIGSNDIVAELAAVVTAALLHQREAVAARLERVVANARFKDLPATIRREVAVLSAETQLSQRRYGAAATALEQLLAEQADPQVEERLRRCQMLQAMQVLGQQPLPEGAFAEILHAAEAVCAGPQPPAIAVLLRVLSQLLVGQCDSAEVRKAALETVKTVASTDAETIRFARIIRVWLGDKDATTDLAGDFSLPEFAALKRVVEIVAASLQKKPGPLKDEAKRVLAAESLDSAFDAEDLVVVAALADASKAEQAAALLTQWHATGHSSDRTRDLLSKLLAKQAARSLKLKRFGQTRTLLRQSLAAVGLATEES